jgi:FkbM family methyltransferase
VRVLKEWCEAYTPRTGDVVVDVGAGIGEETVVFSKMVGCAGRVVAIEAHPFVFSCLAETITRSGLRNAHAIQCAIGDRNGTLRISDKADHLGNSVLSGMGGTKVPARSLDSVVKELGLDRIDLLKVNIEGAERLALRGMGTVADRVRNVVIECHDFVADAGGPEAMRTREFVADALRELGYIVRAHEQVTTPWLRDRISGHRGD